MVSGHFGLAYLLRSARPGASLAALLVASIAPDLVDLGYAAARFCSPMGLYSHSLPALAILAAVVFVAALAATRRAGLASVFAAAVLLHLPADLITGEKLLWPGGPVAGLVMYEYPIADFFIELPIIVAGWMLLRRGPTAPRWATNMRALVILILMQAGMDSAKLFGVKGKPSGCVPVLILR